MSDQGARIYREGEFVGHAGVVTFGVEVEERRDPTSMFVTKVPGKGRWVSLVMKNALPWTPDPRSVFMLEIQSEDRPEVNFTGKVFITKISQDRKEFNLEITEGWPSEEVMEEVVKE